MRIYQHKWRDSRTGRTGVTKKWYLEFRDHHERLKRVVGFLDKAQTVELGNRIEHLVALRTMGDAPSASVLQWLERLAPQILERLAKLDLIDPALSAAVKPLPDHLDDFLASLLAKGTTERHANLVTGRARRICDDCGFQALSDLKAAAAEQYLLRRRAAGLSIQTSNFYLQAIKQFCRWLVDAGRLQASPLQRLRPLNARTDRRHDRRALTETELAALLRSTQAAPSRFGMTGPERALLYRLAVSTGLRRGELASLTPTSFSFGKAPTVAVEAAYSKRRRRDVLPLKPEIAADLKRHLKGRATDEPALAVPARHKTAPMIRADLKDAGIAYRDAAGRVADFHALRHTFITNLARHGVHPKVAQTLARHCTITLTLDCYTHVDEDQTRQALERIPA